jgi:hypothetical protein
MCQSTTYYYFALTNATAFPAFPSPTDAIIGDGTFTWSPGYAYVYASAATLSGTGGSQTGYGFGSVTVHVLAVAFTGSMGSRSRFERYACLVDATGLYYYTITILATFAYVAAYSTGSIR